MNLKKMIFINAIGTFILCFLTHFLYEWIPNPIFSLFFPVNESIWEHMKMLYTTILLFGILECIIYKRSNLHPNNILITIVLKSIISIPIYLIIFLPLYYIFGENMFISISVLLIALFITNYLGYLLNILKEIPYQKLISVILVIVVYIIMVILTYKPPKTELFFDPKNEYYGIKESNKK